MGDISVGQALKWPLVLLAAMWSSAAVTGQIANVDGTRAFLPYVFAWAAVTLLAAMVWVFAQVARLAPTRAEQPLQRVFRLMRHQQRLAMLPALIFPLFIGAYTWAKTSIPFLVGYGWEAQWADLDHALFGEDAWRLVHQSFSTSLASSWTFFYAVVWGLALAIVGSLISAFANHRFTAIFFTAMMLSWFVGGFMLAYALSAAGPVFAHLADPALADRFEPLRVRLVEILGPDNIVMTSQRYLEANFDQKVAVKGGGISAMPSMHIATATIFVLAARGTHWRALALLFLGLTFFGSIYLGYHYAVDAPVAALVAVVCWAVARQLYRRSDPPVIESPRESQGDRALAP